jgi:mycothiol synthase
VTSGGGSRVTFSQVAGPGRSHSTHSDGPLLTRSPDFCSRASFCLYTVRPDLGDPAGTLTPVTPSPSGVETIEVVHDGARGTARRERYGWEIELAAGTGRLDVAAATTLLGRLATDIARQGGGVARWRVPAATPEHQRIAREAGLDGTRRVVQMRRPLPLPWSSTLDTRPFRPGVDDREWLELNNAAFHWHPEQSGWEGGDLHERIAAPWFDAEGFLLHPSDGALTGFCWTKVHRELDPPIGEIYVIGVHPDAAGRGLGRELVLAGLDHLATRGLEAAMLYTEADNRPARALYDRLGFTVHHEVTVFERAIGSEAGPHG